MFISKKKYKELLDRIEQLEGDIHGYDDSNISASLVKSEKKFIFSILPMSDESIIRRYTSYACDNPSYYAVNKQLSLLWERIDKLADSVGLTWKNSEKKCSETPAHYVKKSPTAKAKYGEAKVTLTNECINTDKMPKKKPGRPKGSKNKTTKKKVGRPKGSKNKVKK